MTSSRREAAAERLRRALRLSFLPGATQAEACRATGVSPAALRRARREAAAQPIRIDRVDLVLAALTQLGRHRTGPLGELATLASWLDYVNHDGTTAESLEQELAALVRDGWIAIEAGHFRLLRPWP